MSPCFEPTKSYYKPDTLHRKRKTLQSKKHTYRLSRTHPHHYSTLHKNGNHDYIWKWTNRKWGNMEVERESE